MPLTDAHKAQIRGAVHKEDAEKIINKNTNKEEIVALIIDKLEERDVRQLIYDNLSMEQLKKLVIGGLTREEILALIKNNGTMLSLINSHNPYTNNEINDMSIFVGNSDPTKTELNNINQVELEVDGPYAMAMEWNFKGSPQK